MHVHTNLISWPRRSLPCTLPPLVLIQTAHPRPTHRTPTTTQTEPAHDFERLATMSDVVKVHASLSTHDPSTVGMSLAHNIMKGGGELTANLTAQGDNWFSEWKTGLQNATVVVVIDSNA